MHHCCKNCGHVTRYNVGHAGEKYECVTGRVDENGICDRYQPDISPSQIMKRVDAELKKLEKSGIEDGQYKLKVRPPFGQNYRVQGKNGA